MSPPPQFYPKTFFLLRMMIIISSIINIIRTNQQIPIIPQPQLAKTLMKTNINKKTCQTKHRCDCEQETKLKHRKVPGWQVHMWMPSLGCHRGWQPGGCSQWDRRTSCSCFDLGCCDTHSPHRKQALEGEEGIVSCCCQGASLRMTPSSAASAHAWCHHPAC